MTQRGIYLNLNDNQKKFFDNHKVKIEWKISNFEEVEIGQLLAYVSSISKVFKESIPVYSNCKGYCKISMNGINSFELSNALGYIYDKYRKSFPNVPTEAIDEFSGNPYIKWKKIGGFNSIGIPLSQREKDDLYLSTIYTDSKICLVIDFNSKSKKLKKGDTISFKFSNKKILDFTIETKPTTVLSPYFPEENGYYANAVCEENAFIWN